MGASLIAEAIVVGKDLSHSAKLGLIRMALSAKDNDSNPAYWAGWEPLALTLGYDLPDRNDPEAEKRRRSIRRNVSRAVKEITTAGLIRVPDGHRAQIGTRQRYLLTFTKRVTSPTTLSAKAPRERANPATTLLVDVSDHPGGWSESSQRVTSLTTPRSSEDEYSGASRGELPTPEVPHQRATPLGRDDEYEAAHKTLMAHGPRAHDLVAQILATYPDTSTRDAAVQAAQILKETA